MINVFKKSNTISYLMSKELEKKTVWFDFWQFFMPLYISLNSTGKWSGKHFHVKQRSKCKGNACQNETEQYFE